MALDMCPVQAQHNAVNGGSGNPVLLRETALYPARAMSRACADIENILIGKLGEVRTFTSSISMSAAKILAFGLAAFHHRVSHIRQLISQKEMRWPNTRGRVAFVANPHSLRDRAVRKFPLDAMREPVNPPSVPYLEGAVPIAIGGTSPAPAAVHIDVGVLGHSFDGGCSVFAHDIAIIAQLAVDFEASGGQ